MIPSDPHISSPPYRCRGSFRTLNRKNRSHQHSQDSTSPGICPGLCRPTSYLRNMLYRFPRYIPRPPKTQGTSSCRASHHRDTCSTPTLVILVQTPQCRALTLGATSGHSSWVGLPCFALLAQGCTLWSASIFFQTTAWVPDPNSECSESSL